MIGSYRKKNCNNCRFNDQFRFCSKLVIDKRSATIEDTKYVWLYYLEERKKNDDRTAFVTPKEFKCVFYKPKKIYK